MGDRGSPIEPAGDGAAWGCKRSRGSRDAANPGANRTAPAAFLWAWRGGGTFRAFPMRGRALLQIVPQYQWLGSPSPEFNSIETALSAPSAPSAPAPGWPLPFFPIRKILA